MKKIALLGVLLAAWSFASAQTERISIPIKYISAENVYLDGGRALGLAEGDSLFVYRDSTHIAVLHATFVADYSTACVVLSQTKTPQIGDLAWFEPPEKSAPTEKPAVAAGVTASPGNSKKTVAAPHRTRLTGSFSAHVYHINDRSDSRYRYNQPGARLNVRLQNILAPHVNFYIRTRARYNERSYLLNTGLPQTEWRSRVYAATLSYDDESAPFNFRAGRIISNTFSGIGYLDGFLLQHNMTGQIKLGMFAGTSPQWQYARFQTNVQKYGAYLNYTRGDYQARRYEGTLALAGEYHGGAVSREFFYVQNNYRARHFDLFQSAEVDVNRTWRKEKTGQSLSLTNLFINLNYHMLKSLSAGLSFDDRQNYYTYEIRSLADSLFDDAMRYGARAFVNWRLPNETTVFANGGMRRRDKDAQFTWAGAVGYSRHNWTAHHFSVNVNLSGFSSYYADGFLGALQFGRIFRRGHDISLGYGNYTYIVRAGGGTRGNQWLRLSGAAQLSGHFFAAANYEFLWGSDLPGQRIYGELGYRF